MHFEPYGCCVATVSGQLSCKRALPMACIAYTAMHVRAMYKK